jgi:hypothetical protein
LRIGGNTDQATSGSCHSRSADCRKAMERNARSADVVGEDFSQFVVGNFADERH